MRNRQASLLFIFITALIDIIGVGIIIPIVPTLITQLTGLGLSEAAEYGGWLMASYAIMQFLFAPVLGSLSDKFGRRPILFIALFGLGADYLFQAYAPSIAWLFVGRLLAGLCGASITVATAYVSDISTSVTKAKNFGILGAAFGLGFIIGPVMGGLAAAEWGVKAPFFIAAALSFANLLFGLLILPESLPKNNRRNFSLKNANPLGSLLHLKKYPLLGGLIFSLFLIHMAGQSLPATWVYFTELQFHWDEKMVGLSLGAVGVLVTIAQAVLVGWSVKKYGNKKTIIIGMTLWTFGLVCFALSGNTLAIFLSIIPYCLGGIAGPTLQGIISNQVPDNEQGELQGSITSIISLTTILSPLIMTWIFAYFTSNRTSLYLPGAPYLLAACFMLIGFILAVKTLNRNKELIQEA
ncbi:TCR/Tet family MFS transporter [Sphingobacteriaceae bacterium AH-315-L07]|nr:TCR/Tet family MFS transporter [Sphingobacteriaceae bacterium AH-315-L07]